MQPIITVFVCLAFVALLGLLRSVRDGILYFYLGGIFREDAWKHFAAAAIFLGFVVAFTAGAWGAAISI